MYRYVCVCTCVCFTMNVIDGEKEPMKDRRTNGQRKGQRLLLCEVMANRVFMCAIIISI